MALRRPKTEQGKNPHPHPEMELARSTMADSTQEYVDAWRRMVDTHRDQWRNNRDAR